MSKEIWKFKDTVSAGNFRETASYRMPSNHMDWQDDLTCEFTDMPEPVRSVLKAAKAELQEPKDA